jgi:hypothetical protein
MIRPDSATATSEFSASYDIGNAIDGSGLPANFTPADAHATYTTNNHWTTRANQTIGQSATFTFNVARTIGGFYMWNHRSNGIASNPFYEVTRFDLVLRDGPGGSGNVLANLTNIDSLPNVATAQTFAFGAVANVRSIQFIVRATENNNSSIYTGLAEVAFTPCVSPERLTLTPAALCRGKPWSATAAAVATGPVAYLWRKDGIALDTIANPSAATATLSLPEIEAGFGLEGTYDCVVTNACGSATTQGFVVEVPACDCIDFNNDASSFDPQDIEAFLSVYAEGPCVPETATCSDIDFNNDGALFDPCDIDSFLLVFSEGPCTLCGQ